MSLPLKRVVDLETWRPVGLGVVGIDPGESGCLAFMYLEPPEPPALEPNLEGVYWKASDREQVVSALERLQEYTVAAWCEEIHPRGDVSDAAVTGAKRLHKSPKAIFQQGVNYGMIRGWVDGHLDYVLVGARTWQTLLPERPPKGLDYTSRKRWLADLARNQLPCLAPYLPVWAADGVLIGMVLRDLVLSGKVE